MRNFAILAVCASMFGAHFLSQDQSTETQAASQPTFASEDSAGSAAMLQILERLESIEQRLAEPKAASPSITDQGKFVPIDGPVDTQFVNMRSDAVCTSGSCGVVSRSSYAGKSQVRRGLFGRRIVVTPNSSSSGQRRFFANRGPGNRFPILGRLFGRRR
jgi:hypothetical protein